MGEEGLKLFKTEQLQLRVHALCVFFVNSFMDVLLDAILFHFHLNISYPSPVGQRNSAYPPTFLVIQPVSFVLGSVGIEDDAITMSLAVEEVPDVLVAHWILGAR